MHAQGRTLTQGGTAGYALSYEYDTLGHLSKLHTYRSSGTDDATTWAYDAASGVLLSKTDAAGRSVSYTYDAAGRPLTRAWQRGITTTYGYDGAGRYTSIDYSDSTPDVSMTYDRAGRRVGATDAAGTHAFTYDNSTAGGGQQATWGVTGSGAWSGLSAGYSYTSGRRTSRSTSLGSIPVPAVSYAYDTTSGRMTSVSASGFAASYSYATATGWNSGVSYTGGLGSTRTPDALGRLDSISWSVGATTLSGHDYTLNAMNRRTDALRQDGSSWSYGYNTHGEVTSAAKGTEPGKQFGYAYDGIGNRLSSTVSSLTNPTVPPTTTYTPNALNQYASIAHPQPGSLVLRGSTNTTPNVTVTINGNPSTQRSGALWYYEQSVTNSDGPVRQMVDIAASSSTGGLANGPVTTHQKGVLFIPPPSEVPTYDEDGNLTSDARWNYTWDGENRLIVQEEKPGIPVQPTGSASVKRFKLEFSYDALGRRISKRISTAASTGGFVLQQSLVYLYDGWNMIAEIDTTSSAQLLRSYEWGMDISGTMAGAGGVGGLLVVRSSVGSYAPLYDGNGNITELVNLADGTFSARYEYGAFGETISVDGGTVAAANPFRFSTKYLDAETGLYNYGYRYYDAVNGRWLNRDPIEENGGVNLYGMCGNDAVNQWDHLGYYPGSAGHGSVIPPAISAGLIATIQSMSDRNLDQTIMSSKSDKGRLSLWRNSVRLFNIFDLIGTNENNRFVFTCKYGWIDHGHLFNNAAYVYHTADKKRMERFAYMNEVAQGLVGSDSAWTPEDLQSNELGRQFGEQMQKHDIGLYTPSNYRSLTPVSATSFFDLQAEWRKLLVSWGAVVWKHNDYARQKLEEDMQKFQREKPAIKSLEAALQWRINSPAYKCLCTGDKPKDPMRVFR